MCGQRNMAICLSHARTSRGLPLSHPIPCIPALHRRVLRAAAVNAACGVWGDYRFRLPNSAFFLAFAAAAESRHADQMDMPKRSMRWLEARRISSSVRSWRVCASARGGAVCLGESVRVSRTRVTCSTRCRCGWDTPLVFWLE